MTFARLMPRLAVLGALLLPAFASAQAFGTKRDAIVPVGAAAAPGIGMMPFIQMMIALGLVFLIVKFVLPKFAAKLNKRLVTSGNGNITIEDSASFAGGNLFVVSVKGKSLLLSVGQNGVSCLADVTETNPQPAKPLFMEILEKEQDTPSHCYVEADGEPTLAAKSSLSDDDIQAALERLSRLSA